VERKLQDTKSSFAADKKLAGIHGLRFLAFFMVLIFHLRDVAGIAPSGGFDRNLGSGVRLFFVISAFSLMYSTTRYMARPDWIKVFAVKRFFRIAPLFYLMIIATSFVGIMGPHNLVDAILSFGFVFNFMPDQQGSLVWAGWTVGVEMIFYAMMPLIIGCIIGVRSSILFLGAGIVLGYAALNAQVHPGMPHLFSYMTFPGQIQFFAAGTAAYFIYLAAQKSVANVMPVVIALAIVVAVGAWSIVTPRISSLPVSTELERNYASCILVFGALVIWQAIKPSWVFSNRFVVYWGERSYSMYLLHGPILIFGHPLWVNIVARVGLTLGYPAVAIVALVLVLCSSWVTYRFIERPGMQLGSRLYRAREDISAPSRTKVIGEW